jgi:hypothetical protein
MAQRSIENTGRVLVLALAFFGGLGVLALANGVFARLGPEGSAMLAGFILAFAFLTWRLDPGVRAFAKRLFRPRATVTKPRSRAAAI